MEAIGYVLIIAISGLLLQRLWRPQKPEASPETPTADEELARGLTALWLELKDLFPYLPTPRVRDTSADAIAEGMALVLDQYPEYGQMPDCGGIPAPGPRAAERRRHLYVVGKTGSGKSTFLEYLVARDLLDGHGVAVVSPESEFFRHRLLNFVPPGRHRDVIYFAPANPKNRITFNPLTLEPGDDAVQAADDLFSILKRTLREDSLGPRMKPLLQNALATLMGRKDVSLWDITRLLEDQGFRERLIADADPYVRQFWTRTYPKYPKGAAVPIINRLDQFLRTPKLRRTLCNPAPGLSVRQALAENKILLLDLFGLNEEQLLLVGQMLLSKFQLELLRREETGAEAAPYFLYCDEFQSFAGMAPGLWRALLSRGRKYGLALTLANQFPGQLPRGVRDEIFGNVNSLVSFVLGSADGKVVQRELLHREDDSLKPVPLEALLDLGVGQAVAKLGGGRAVRLDTPPPISVSDEQADRVAQRSWEQYGSPEDSPGRPTEDRDQPAPPEQTSSQEKPLQEVPQTETSPAARHEGIPPAQPPGRGGPEHTYLQELVKRWGEERGFRSTIEYEVPDGGRVDVALERERKRIACEIAVTTGSEHELENIRKCLGAGFDLVVAISTRKRFLQELERRAREALTEDEQQQVQFLAPEALVSFLDTQAPEDETETIAGYKVSVSYREPDTVEERARRRAMADVIRKSLARLQKTSS